MRIIWNCHVLPYAGEMEKKKSTLQAFSMLIRVSLSQREFLLSKEQVSMIHVGLAIDR